MAVREAQKNYNAKNIKRVPLDMQLAYYEEILAPEAKEAGKNVNSYIKEAIREKIEREGRIFMTKRELLENIICIIEEADEKADKAEPKDWTGIKNKAYEDARNISLNENISQMQFDVLWNKAVTVTARKKGIR